MVDNTCSASQQVNPADWLRGGAQLLSDITHHIPGRDFAIGQALRLERTVLQVVTQHVRDTVGPDPGDTPDENPGEPEPSPAEVLRSLLDKSMYTSPDESRIALHRALLEALLPDEARILAALSDGSPYPVIHVAGADSTVGPALRNASTVGRAAGVSLPQHTPLYVSRLVQLGLVRLGPETAAMRDDYEMLMTDQGVNAALAAARSRLRPARVLRQTVRITDLGREVWEAAK